MSEKKIDQFCEFSTEIACGHGIELAIIHGFFHKHYHLISMVEKKIPNYPSVEICCLFMPFWSEEKIRELIAQLYLNKLI